MESVIRAILVYLFLFLLFRISGKRTLMESSPFALILIFLISSSVGEALKGEDRSVTNSIIQASTLIGLHLFFAMLKSKNKAASKMIEDVPTVLVKNGRVYTERLISAKMREEDLLREARKENLTDLGQVRYAILESDGSISIIKKEN